MTKFLAGLGVGEVALDGRQADGADGVTQGNGGVGVATGVDDDARRPRPRFVQGINQRAFVIGLKCPHFEAERFAFGFERGVNIGQRRRAIHLRLARAEQVEVGAVEDEDGF